MLLLKNVVITDVDGIATDPLAPRVYYKKSTDANTFGGNTSADNGWKWASANGTSSPYDFTINYSILYGTGTVSIGDSIQYFVVAQDLLGALNSSPSTGFSGTTVSSITSAPAAPNQYPYYCYSKYALI